MFEALTDIQFPEDAMRRVERIEFRWAKPEPKKRPTAKNRPKAKASRR
ncbi:MAG: hypothetical protein KBH81_08700 [Phycisphaerae bacterium]|jgi:hypothetical protein|nr:hypothetical protein [Phycisphaerae bacterium]HPC22879.1 hypothetical protein [Phycisphaerae bacterium]HRT41966.1 hypothetical protein [Phycisphaerae bacterium]